jgi:hypothetical protein
VSDDPFQQIECRGDPRAMGNQQGRALRSVLRQHVATSGVDRRARRRRMACSLWPFASGPVLGAGAGREIARHYPHLCERIQGLAAGADVALAGLMQLFIRAASNELPGDPLCEASELVAHCGPSGAMLTRGLSLGVGVGAGSAWLVRRSRPDVGFASVELTLPWLACAVVGVNEAGLSAALAPTAAARGASPRARPDAPPAMLLAQECLQRFESLDACVDWSLKRPASGDLCLVVLDASGEAAAVEFSGSQRRVVRAHDGVLVAAGRDVRRAEALEAGSAEAALPCSQAGDWLVCVDPSQRRLRIRSSQDASESAFPVDAD